MSVRMVLLSYIRITQVGVFNMQHISATHYDTDPDCVYPYYRKVDDKWQYFNSDEIQWCTYNTEQTHRYIDKRVKAGIIVPIKSSRELLKSILTTDLYEGNICTDTSSTLSLLMDMVDMLDEDKIDILLKDVKSM